MKHFKLIFCALLFLFAMSVKAQKKGAFVFQYNGQTFQLIKGSKIQLGNGTGNDGAFAFIERDEVITQNESYDNNRGSQSSKNTKLYTGEKEYLRSFYTNKSITVNKVKYYKKMDQYRLYVFTTDGIFTLHIEEAINRGEVTAINGISLGNESIISQPVNNNNADAPAQNNQATSGGLNHILYLNNGSEIKCKVLEIVPNDYIKIETYDKSTFVFKMDEVKQLKETGAQTLPANNYPVASSSSTGSNFSIQSPSGISVKNDTTPLGYFYNTTELTYYLPNSVAAKASYLNESDIYIIDAGSGFGFKNISGYVFKNYVFLGGGIGYGGYIENPKQQYHAFYFALNQQLFALAKKKISPTVSLYQNFGAIASGLSFTQGSFKEFAFNFGARFSLGDNLYLASTLGFALQLFRADVTRYNYNSYGGSQIVIYDNKSVKASYFSVNVALGFKK